MCAVLLAVIWKANASRGMQLFWIVFSLFLGGSYLMHYHSPSQHSSILGAFHPRTLHYLLVYLGNPFSKFNTLAGALVGLVGLVLFFFFTGRFIMLKGKASFFHRFAFSQITYLVFTAVITAVGRNKFGVIQATAGRYCTPVLLFWFFLLILVYTSVEAGGKTARRIRVSVLSFLFLIVLPFQLRALPHMKIEYTNFDEASLGLIAGVEDTSMMYRYLYPNDSLIWERNEFLKLHRLSVYREPWAHLLDQHLFEEYELDTNSVPVELEEIRPLDFSARRGYFVRGKIRLPLLGKAPELIFFAVRDSVIGYAKTLKRPCLGCFSGYVRGLENKSFDMYGLENQNSRRIFKIATYRDH